jgi:hypothetical protein
MDLMDFLFHYLKWTHKLMLKILNLISNNYFLKQKLSVPTLNSPVRRLTDTWQGISKQGKKIIEEKLTAKKYQTLMNFYFCVIYDLKEL